MYNIKEYIILKKIQTQNSANIKHNEKQSASGNRLDELKQARRCWNEYLTKILMKCGLKQSKEGSCFFFAREENKFMFCAIHIDNMTVVLYKVMMKLKGSS